MGTPQRGCPQRLGKAARKTIGETTMTLYVPVNESRNFRALPFDSMTAASLFVIQQEDESEWRVEAVASLPTQAEWRVQAELDRDLSNAVAYGKHFDAFLNKIFP